MARIVVLVEGQTEETFVRDILAPHLQPFGHLVYSNGIGSAKGKSNPSGIRGWEMVSKAIQNQLNSHPQLYVTTMVDFYALPSTQQKAWPGRAQAALLPFPQKSPAIHNAILADVINLMGDSFNPNRFIPYVMMYEYEGLLFSDCGRFAQGIGQPALALGFQAIRDQFTTPEEINDSPLTAPSKRIETLVPGYEKPLLGTLAALEIGIDQIRKECPLFHHWLTTLETLP